jgi:hypothetical protein
MAIVLPLLLMLTFGLTEYGWLLLKVEQANGVARYAARLATLPDATNGGVLAAIAQQMSDAGITTGYTVTFTPGDVSSPKMGELVRVQIQVRYQGNIDLGMPLVPVPATFRASVSMAKEGP